MAAATEERAFQEQREAQARQHKEREMENICKFAGAEPGKSWEIIQNWILGLMGLRRWWQPFVSSPGARCMGHGLEHWDCTAESQCQGC